MQRVKQDLNTEKDGDTMPNRIIKESICTSENIAALSMGAEVLFYHLIVKADDYGVYFGNEQIIRSTCYPLKTDEIKLKQVTAWVNELVSAGLVNAYIADDGKKYIQFSKWAKHQQIRAKRSKYPTMDDSCQQLLADDCKCPRNPIQSNPNPIQSESAQSADEIESCFLALWDLYPKKVDKSSVSKKAKAELHKAGFDVVSSAIENYKEEIQRENRDIQYVKIGSTFFNGAWKDYLESSELSEEPQKPKRGGSF